MEENTLPPPPNVPDAVPEPHLDDVTLADDSAVFQTPATPKNNEVPGPTVEEAESILNGEASSKGAADDEGAPLQKKMHNFTLQYEVTSEKQSPRIESIDLPSDLGSHLAEVVRRLPNVEVSDTTPGAYWAATVRGGRAAAMAADVFESALSNPDNHFSQSINVEGKVLKPGPLPMKATEGGALSGERAVIRFTNSMGLGGIFDVPLWDTGIWIRFKPPSDAAIADLMEQLAHDKVKLGRATYGLVFSNSTVFVNQRLIQFAMNHIYDMTLDLDQTEYNKLGDIISVLDIPDLILGVLGALYSSGFRFERACTANPQKCTHVEAETLSLDKIQWPNDRKLTPFQKNFMAVRRSRCRKLSELQEYRNQSVGRAGLRVTLPSSTGESLEVELRIPTINQYLEGGQTWINGIVDGVISSLGRDASLNDRDEYIKTVAQASAMNQYCHAVSKLYKGEEFTEDDASNRQVLAALSQDPLLVEGLTREVIKYIEDSSMSLIAIPDYTCPNCQQSQLSEKVKKFKNPDPEYRNLIPLDMIQTFFLLTQRRIQLIKER